MKFILVFSSIFSFLLTPFSVYSFDSAEHMWMGDLLELYFPECSMTCVRDTHAPLKSIKRCEPPILRLDNGLELTYGQIMALGGDFYASNHPVSFGADGDEKRSRFLEGFNSLTKSDVSVREVPEILKVVAIEFNMIDSYLTQGKAGLLAYHDLGVTLSKRWNKITGGGSFLSDWYPKGRYLKIQENNYDHFLPHAWEVYNIGHHLALLEARRGHYAKRPNEKEAHLHRAYALNAFSSHYLSDIFSAGHIRTPRNLLPKVLFWNAPGHYLSKFMHDEDGLMGLYVINKQGKQWKAYGDGTYFEKLSDDNRSMLEIALQYSVDEIYETFTTGEFPVISYVESIIPKNWDFSSGEFQNHAPLFKKINEIVLERRKYITKPYVYDFTKKWFSLTSIRKLQKIRKVYQHFGPSDVMTRKFVEEK